MIDIADHIIKKCELIKSCECDLGHPEMDNSYCVGYGFNDDEPCPRCKKCSAYTGNRLEDNNG